MGTRGMDQAAFRKSLKAKGKKNHVVDDLCERVAAFEQQLAGRGRTSEEATPDDIAEFCSRAESLSGNDLRALALYFRFIGSSELARYASELREESIAGSRRAFKLGQFQGVDQDHTAKLAAEGIVDVNQMISAGRTPELRGELARRTGIPLRSIEEYVRLSDLSRLGAIKTVRARLYLEAGLDTIDKIAALTPEAFRQAVVEFVERSGFAGIPTLPKEAENAVRTARHIERLVVWEE